MSTSKALRALATITIVAIGGLMLPATVLAARVYTAAPEFHIGEPGSGEGQLLRPKGIAVNEETGDVYVADMGNHRVDEFSPSGAYITQFNGVETPAHAFAGPSEIAVDNSTGPRKGDVYVVAGFVEKYKFPEAVEPGVINVFDAHGEYVSQLTGTPSEAFTDVLGIAVDGSGDLWVYATTDAEPLKVVSPDTVYEFSETGALLQQFKASEGNLPELAVDASQNVFVSGCCGKKITEYGASGNLLGSLTATQPLNMTGSPANDNVFVLSDNNSYPADHVEEFSPSGRSAVSKLSATFGTPPEAPKTGVLRGDEREPPEGIAVNGSDGTVYVAQSEAGLVYVFEDLLLPAVSAGSASSLTRTTATVTGMVSPEGHPITACVFEYASSAFYAANKAYEASEPCSQELSSLTGSSPLEVSTPLAGLTYGDTYHYRLVASNSGGATDGPDGTFAVVVAPSVSSQSASLSHVTQATALIAGLVDPEGLATTCDLEYGPTDAYGDVSEQISVGSANTGAQCGPVVLSGLSAGATYHYRFVASSQAGTSYGPDHTFTTAPATRPIVVTGAASVLSGTEATLTGVLQPRGLASSYEFEVGSGAAGDYEGAKLFGNAGSSAGSETVSVTLRYLVPGSTYHYRLVAVNEDGTGYGQDMTFTTPGVASPISQPLSTSLLSVPSTLGFPSMPAFRTKTKSKTKAKAKSKARSLSRSRRLKRALKACRRGPKGARAGCERRARGRYGKAKR